MKQILIITRITSISSEDEFSNLFPSRKEPVIQNQSDLFLSIHQGLNFYAKNESEIANKIKGKIKDEATEVLIILHYTEFDKVKSELIKLQNNTKWEISKYSTIPQNEYENIKFLFQKVTDDSTKVKEIYNLFSHNWILEAKLELLQKIVIGETRKKENEAKFFQLPDKLRKFQKAFERFSDQDKDFFAVITDEDENAFNQYKKAYDKFYDALEIED